MKKLTIFINDQLVYDYDLDINIGDEQLMFLDKMDGDMDRGIDSKVN